MHLKYVFIYQGQYVKFDFSRETTAFSLESDIQDSTSFSCIYVGKHSRIYPKYVMYNTKTNHLVVIKFAPNCYLNYDLKLSSIPRVWTYSYFTTQLFTPTEHQIYWENDALHVGNYIRDHIRDHAHIDQVVQFNFTCTKGTDSYVLNNFIVIDGNSYNMKQRFCMCNERRYCWDDKGHILYYGGSGLNYQIYGGIQSFMPSIRDYLKIYDNVLYIYINSFENNQILNVVPNNIVKTQTRIVYDTIFDTYHIKYDDYLVPSDTLFPESVILSKKKLKFLYPLKNILDEVKKYNLKA